MSIGGGGGDGGAAARKEEEEARVSQAIGKINNTFGIGNPDAMNQREALYGTVKTDAINKTMEQLNKEKADTARGVNFQLARQGLSGGSADVDNNKRIVDKYQEGVLSAANIGDSTANTARTNDEKTRVNLINSIRSGLDQGTANQMAYEGMNNNIAAAKNEAASANLSGFFNTLNNQFQNLAYQQGVDQTQQQNKQLNPTFKITGDKGSVSTF